MMTSQNPERKAAGLDLILLGTIFALSALGLVMVMSASGIMAEKEYGNKYVLFEKQAKFMCIGLLIMLFAIRVDMNFFYRRTYLWLILAITLLVALFTPLGTKVGGATRWLRLGPFSLQPLELAKIALVFYLAYFFANKQGLVKTFSVGFLPPIAMTGLLCALLLLQPDFGGAVFLAAILFLLCLAGGTRIIFLGATIIMAGVSCVFLIVNEPYRYQRLTAFLDPFKDAQDTGYQLVQSLYAFGAGGWFGQGLGEGKQKLFFLPEAHNDFIMSVLGEELGFVGVSALILLLGLVLWRTISISIRQSNIQDRITAFGMGAILVIGGVLNLAVVLGVVPPKGVPMPFLSYGGSHLVAGFFCAGILLNLSRRARVTA